MAYDITGVGAVQVDKTAYNLATDYTLRPELYFDQVASVTPTMQAHPGSTVSFTITDDLAIASTSLNESTDVTPVAMSDNAVTVALAEYGNAVRTSALLRGTSFIVPYDPVVANVIGYNAGVSLDTIARDVLKAGTNVTYGGGAAARAGVAAGYTLTSSLIRQQTAILARNNVMPLNGSYVAYIHPDVSYDLRSETGAAAWRDPHVYSAPEQIWNGEVGLYERVRFIEAPRAPIFADAGSSTTFTDVYRTMFVGQQALAKAYSYTDGNGAMPKVVQGPVVDVLNRFVPLGWYWLGGYGIYRETALRAVETSSSIGDNSSATNNYPAING